MINIRHNLFETNSSSVHSMTLLTEDEYNKWVSGDYYLDFGEGRVLTPEEVQIIVSEYVNKWGDSYPETDEEFDEILEYQDIYSPDSFEMRTEYYETFCDRYDKNGHTLYAIGYTGYDG